LAICHRRDGIERRGKNTKNGIEICKKLDKSVWHKRRKI